ncbi:MAG: GldG family protein [Chthoniobacteraceae bacterium]|nr:GldG family protein [Chthoniobacteraceae bacterium]
MAKNASIPRTKIGLNVLLQAVAFLALFALVNYLGFNHYKRWDFSRDQKYTLSQQTRRVIGNLKAPVRMIAFFSGGSPIAQDTVTLLREYAAASKKRIEVDVVDPFRSMAQAREIATQYKLRDNDNVVIIATEGRTKFVNAADMAEYEPSLNLIDKPRVKTFKGETALTSALIEISEAGSNQIYGLSGHGEPLFEARSPFSGLKAYIERQNVKVSPLKLTDVESVPPDAKALLIIAPRYDFSDAEIHALHNYWAERRGRIFVALEPTTPTPKLAAFLAEAGIAVHDDRVLRTYPIKLATGMFRGVMKEITGDILPGSLITKRLGNVSVSFIGGVTQSLGLDTERAAAAGISLKPLIRASSPYWGETHYTEQAVYFNPKEDYIDPIVAASAEKGALANESVRVDSARLVVLGSSAFLSNEILTDTDLDFVLSSLNWLLDREEIIGIAPKPVRNLSLNLTDSQMSSIGLLTILAIPACAAVLGFFLWLKRRR